MGKSSRSSKPSKFAKPRPDFPLFPHATGRWAKKVRGKLHYFGKCADDRKGRAALNLWLDQRDDLLAGRVPSTDKNALKLRELVNRFLTSKQTKVDSGELAAITWTDYHATCRRLLECLGDRQVDGLGPDDFGRFRAEVAKTNKLVGVRNQITRTRAIFNFAYKQGLIDHPIRFGIDFARPSTKAIRRQRTPKMFEAVEISLMLENASPVMKAMILLGCNCGFGCTDVGRLPKSALDLDGGWVTFARSKTGSERRIPLWPETAKGIKAALAVRPKPTRKEYGDLVFLTKTGGTWDKDSTRYLSEQFRKFIEPLGLHKPGRGFYALRHVFETIGGESLDQVAVDAIMGHERGEMSSHYRERVSDQRLQRVVETVREWLFSKDEQLDDDQEQGDVIPFRVVG